MASTIVSCEGILAWPRPDRKDGATVSNSIQPQKRIETLTTHVLSSPVGRGLKPPNSLAKTLIAGADSGDSKEGNYQS